MEEGESNQSFVPNVDDIEEQCNNKNNTEFRSDTVNEGASNEFSVPKNFNTSVCGGDFIEKECKNQNSSKVRSDEKKEVESRRGLVNISSVVHVIEDNFSGLNYKGMSEE